LERRSPERRVGRSSVGVKTDFRAPRMEPKEGLLKAPTSGVGKRGEETTGRGILESQQDSRRRMTEDGPASVLPEIHQTAAVGRIEPKTARAVEAGNERKQVTAKITHRNLSS
jgi:hypothetical protein